MQAIVTEGSEKARDSNPSYLLSHLAPTSTPTPRMLKNFVKMENFPRLNFSLENSTWLFSDENTSESVGRGAVYSGRSGFFVDVMTLPSLIGPSGG